MESQKTSLVMTNCCFAVVFRISDLNVRPSSTEASSHHSVLYMHDAVYNLLISNAVYSLDNNCT